MFGVSSALLFLSAIFQSLRGRSIFVIYRSTPLWPPTLWSEPWKLIGLGLAAFSLGVLFHRLDEAFCSPGIIFFHGVWHFLTAYASLCIVQACACIDYDQRAYAIQWIYRILPKIIKLRKTSMELTETTIAKMEDETINEYSESIVDGDRELIGLSNQINQSHSHSLNLDQPELV